MQIPRILVVLVLAVSWNATSATSAAEPASAAPAPTPLVVIDAGHGGKDPGTKSRSHIAEKDVTLAIATKMAGELRSRGVDVILTRASDTFVSLDDRVNLSNGRGTALFVSIHCDANSDAAMKGFSVLRARSSSSSAAAAAQIISRNLKSAGVAQRSTRRDDRGLRVLNGTRAPAVLVETGFLSNRMEAVNLASSAYQTRLAGAIAGGIAEYIRASSSATPAIRPQP